MDWGRPGVSDMGFNQRRRRANGPQPSGPNGNGASANLGAIGYRLKSWWPAVWISRAARKARPSFYPTIETALLAGAPWLAYQCPSCQLIGDVDLRTLDRHPMMAISGLIPSLSCRWCCSNPPFARLVALTAESTVAAALCKGRKR